MLAASPAGLINYFFNAPFAFPGPAPFTMARYVVAGFAIGVGTRFQRRMVFGFLASVFPDTSYCMNVLCFVRGCTSGHGICGLPRFSKRSWFAVPGFMLFAGCREPQHRVSL